MGAALVPIQAGPVPAPRVLTLYQIDDDLRAHLDTLDLVAEGTPEREALEIAIAQYMEALPAKVDRVAATYRWLESLAAIAKAEKTFYALRQATLEATLERLEKYIVLVLGKQLEPKRGAKKLQGDRYTLALGSSEAVKITDETQIPSSYKTANVQMEADDWLRATYELPWLGGCAKVTISTRAADVKAALKGGEEITGADLETRGHLRIS